MSARDTFLVQSPSAAYLLTLTRAMESKLEAWPLQLADKLPIVRVPLRSLDADVPLDLHAALNEIYDEAAYDLSIDYRQRHPSSLCEEGNAVLELSSTIGEKERHRLYIEGKEIEL